jgi:transposase
MSLMEWDAKRELQIMVDEENDRRAKLAAKIAAMKPASSGTDDSRHSKGVSKDGRPTSQTSALEAELLELQQIQQTPVKTASEILAEQEGELSGMLF